MIGVTVTFTISMINIMHNVWITIKPNQNKQNKTKQNNRKNACELVGGSYVP